MAHNTPQEYFGSSGSDDSLDYYDSPHPDERYCQCDPDPETLWCVPCKRCQQKYFSQLVKKKPREKLPRDLNVFFELLNAHEPTIINLLPTGPLKRIFEYVEANANRPSKKIVNPIVCYDAESIERQRDLRKVEILEGLSKSPKFNHFQRIPKEIRENIVGLVAENLDVEVKKIDIDVPNDWEDLV